MNWLDNDWENKRLEKVPSLSQAKIELKQQLIIGNWTINKLILPTKEVINLLKESKSYMGLEGLKSKNNMITIADIEVQNLIYQFNLNGSYNIFAGDKLIRAGKKWGLTKDGKYIYLDAPIGRKHLIEVLNLKQGKMTIKYQDKIALPRGDKGEFNSEYLELDLKRD